MKLSSDRLAREGAQFTVLGEKFELTAPEDSGRRLVRHMSGRQILTIKRYPGCWGITARDENRMSREMNYEHLSTPLDEVVSNATVTYLRNYPCCLKGGAARHIFDDHVSAQWIPWPVDLTPEAAALLAPNLITTLFGAQQ